MIGTADPSTVADTPPDDDAIAAAQVDLGTASSVTIFGTLIWLGPLLGLVAVAYAIVVVCVAIWGDIDTSLWVSIAAGWQRWPLGVIGFLMIATFSRMFVENGVTRRRLGDAATVSLVLLSTLSGTYITLGFLIERVVYDTNDWPQMNDERNLTYGAIGYATVLLTYTVVAAAYFVSGWLLGIVFNRDRDIVVAVLSVPLAIIPVAVCELLVTPMVGGAQIDVLSDLMSLSLWVSTPITIAVIVGAVYAARRATLDVIVK